MALNEAYGQTDVWNDERWVRATAQGRGPVAKQARERLKEMEHEKSLQQSAQQFAMSHAQSEAARRDALEARREAHGENLAQRQLAQQQLDAYRQAQLGQAAESRRSRESAGWLNLAQSPDLDVLYGDKAPAIKKYALNQYFNSLQQGGGGAPQGGVPAAGGAGGVEGVVGGVPANPRAVAVRNQLQTAGEKVTPQTAPTTTNAPAGVPQRGNVAGVPQGGGGGFAPGELAPAGGAGGGGGGAGDYMHPDGVLRMYPPVGPEGTAQLSRILALKSKGEPYVEGGFVHNQPAGTAGMDFNTNTGEWVPKEMVGTINGRPANEVLRNPVYSNALTEHGIAPPGQVAPPQQTGPTTPGEQAGLPKGYKVLSPGPGEGVRYNPATGRFGADEPTVAGGPGDTSGRNTPGASPIPPTDVAPPGTPPSAPAGSIYGTDAGAPKPGTLHAGLEKIFGPIRFGAGAAYSPTDLGKPNAWTVPPSMRGPNAGVPNIPESQPQFGQQPQAAPQFAPTDLVAPPNVGTGPFGHPVPALTEQEKLRRAQVGT